MDQQSLQGLITAIKEIEVRVQRAGSLFTPLSSVSYAERQLLIQHRKLFNTAAAGWQEHTTNLLEVLQALDTGESSQSVFAAFQGVMQPATAPQILATSPEENTTSVTLPSVPTGTRLGLDDSWTDRRPYVFCIEPGVYLQTRSFRDIYVTTLQQLAQRYGDAFIPNILAHKEHSPLKLQPEPNTYSTPFISLQGYAFNLNSSADSLRTSIRFLYGAFGLKLDDFGCWER